MNGWKRDFFLVWGGQAVSLVGSGLVQFALVWWLTETTGSAAVLAGATLAALLPSILVGPFAGALVDRFNRKLVMIAADSAVAAATAVLALLFAMGVMQPWHVFVALFVRSLCGTFQFPAMQASTSLMVPSQHLARIAGLNQMLGGLINIAAPPLGALLMTLLPMVGVIAIDVVTALCAVLPLALVAIPQPRRNDMAAILTPRVLLRDVNAGLRYVRARTGLVMILIMAMVINFFFGPASMLTPLLVKNHFLGGAWQLSLMESAMGVGIVVGSLILSAWGGFKKLVLTSMIGLVGMGAGALLVGAAPSTAFLLALGGMAISGLMNPITNGPLLALLQTRVDPSYQGRVMTLVNSACMAMMPLGTLLAAPLSEILGISAWFSMAGLVCVLMGLAGLLIPAVINLEEDMRKAQVSDSIVHISS